MRVSLVGGNGFIGHHLALGLKREGHDVLVIDNLMWNNLTDNVTGGIDEFRRSLYHGFLTQRFDMLRNAGVEMCNADARSPVDLANALDAFKPTDIVHLSAISSAVEARKRPGLCFDLQLVTLRNVLEYAKCGIRVVLMSSSTVYGNFKGSYVDESTRPQPLGIYANTKYMAERLVRTYSDQYGLATTIIRPSALYGERCISGRVSQKFIESALLGEPLILEGGGDGRLDFTYIEDLVDGIIAALNHKAEGTNTFNITYGNSRSIRELAEVVNSVIPCTFEVRPRDVDKPVRGTLSTKRAENVLGFKAKHPLEDGYLRYCRWYMEQWDAEKESCGGTDSQQWPSHQNQKVSAA